MILVTSWLGKMRFAVISLELSQQRLNVADDKNRSWFVGGCYLFFFKFYIILETFLVFLPVYIKDFLLSKMVFPTFCGLKIVRGK